MLKMDMLKCVATFLIVFRSTNGQTKVEEMEPGQCVSRYDYDYKMLQKVFQLESEISEIKKTLQNCKCQENDNSCAANPCVNGLCTQYLGEQKCSCFAGWTGITCATPNCVDFHKLNKTETITNVAFGKPVSLSSTYGGEALESLMVDGVRKSNWPCTCTQETPVVDLLKSYPIRYLYLLNRGDCCPERLHNLHIWVGNSESDMNLVAHYQGTIGAECTIALPKNTSGRYVKLQIIAAKNYLTLCEVEIYI